MKTLDEKIKDRILRYEMNEIEANKCDMDFRAGFKFAQEMERCSKTNRFKASCSAMQGLASNPELNRVALDDIVKRSIQYADELLRQIKL